MISFLVYNKPTHHGYTDYAEEVRIEDGKFYAIGKNDDVLYEAELTADICITIN